MTYRSSKPVTGTSFVNNIDEVIYELLAEYSKFVPSGLMYPPSLKLR